MHPIRRNAGHSLHDRRKKIPIEIRRKLFLDVTADIGHQLDVLGVTDEDIEREHKAARKRRR